jgi:HK97 family phage portal protein
MLTPEQYEANCRRLDEGRAKRHALDPATQWGGVNVWPTPDDAGTGVVPISIGPGRGNLQYSSMHVPVVPTAMALINKTVSFARLFQTQPWVAAACMWMLTRAIRVPLRVYRKTSKANAAELLMPDQHPVAHMVANPWPGGNSAQFVMNMLGPMLVHGNAVLDVDDSHVSDGALGLTPKDWRYCQPIMPTRLELDGFRFDWDLPLRQYDRPINNVLHVSYWSPTGPIGTSPLMQLNITLSIEDAAQRYQIGVFRNGARPPSAIIAAEAFIGIDPEIRNTIMAQLRQDLTDLYGGPENAGKPALLPPGLDWKEVGQSVIEAALVEQRKLTRDEVCAVYMIPPPLLGILDRATYSNIAIQRDMTYTDCLGPPLVLLEQAINAQIVRDLLQDDQVFVEFDFGAVLRGDRLQEIEMLRNAVQSALLTPNEGRAVLSRPAADLEGMDTFWMPTNNVTPVDQAAKPPATPAPVIAPASPEAAPEEEKTPMQKGQTLYVPTRAYEALFGGERELVH